MKIILLAVGRVRVPYFREGCEDYLRRIRKLTPIEVREIKAVKGADAGSTRKAEGEKIAEALGSIAMKSVALHDRGKALTSEEFAKLVGNVESSGAKGLVFVMGGAYGLSREALEKADYLVSLGPMTMSHELARLALLEQIYRAQTALRGVPYPK